MELKSTGTLITFESPTIPMFQEDLMNYHLLECFGVEECLTSLTVEDVDYSFEHFIENVEGSNDFQEYFSCV